MNVLVTGATGFVMANLVRHLAAEGHDVVAADRVAPDDALERFTAGLPGRVDFRTLDVKDRNAIRGLVAGARPARVVHGAAITSVPPEAERARFLDTVEVNVLGTLNMLDALREAGAGRVVVVSSGSVYGNRPHVMPVAESDVTQPVGVYPWSKWAGESFARRFAEVHRLDVAVVRLASPFGPFERDTGSRPLLSPIAYWTLAALRGQPLHASGARTFMRDAIYAPDVASGIAAVLLADRLGHDVYNVGWGRGATTDETIAALQRLVPGLEIEFHPDQTSPWGSTMRGPLAVDRLCGDLGWRPRYDLDSGLAAYLDWLRKERQA
ncbi:MAG: NAD(P)-dependent oxidoreductase [Candidatus Rokubacteria bacterium]|nr:NAD(P)-dependent oxidoreductase [Candidatus Rokubacteria bacterium]